MNVTKLYNVKRWADSISGLINKFKAGWNKCSMFFERIQKENVLLFKVRVGENVPLNRKVFASRELLPSINLRIILLPAQNVVYSSWNANYYS